MLDSSPMSEAAPSAAAAASAAPAPAAAPAPVAAAAADAAVAVAKQGPREAGISLARKLCMDVTGEEEFDEGDFQRRAAASLAAGAVRVVSGGEYLSELLPDVYSARTLMVRIKGADQSKYACLICVVNGRSESRLSVALERNLPVQFASHCATHHVQVFRPREPAAAASGSPGTLASFWRGSAQGGAAPVEAGAQVGRMNAGRDMIKYNGITDVTTRFFAAGSLPFRVAELSAFRDIALFAGRGYYKSADLPGRNAVSARTVILGTETLEGIKQIMTDALKYNDGRTMNGELLQSRAGVAADGWSATQSSAHLLALNVGVFSDAPAPGKDTPTWRLFSFDAGFLEVTDNWQRRPPGPPPRRPPSAAARRRKRRRRRRRRRRRGGRRRGSSQSYSIFC